MDANGSVIAKGFPCNLWVKRDSSEDLKDAPGRSSLLTNSMRVATLYLEMVNINVDMGLNESMIYVLG